MIRQMQRTWIVLAAASIGVTSSVRAQGEWVAARCDITPGHYLVTSGVLYLRSATTTQFADQRQKDLRDALRVLSQALTSGGQQKNPAAWYYLGRYYIAMRDAAGADSSFTRAVALAPACAADVDGWRRQMWVPLINAGVAAWQAGNVDSAATTFRRANQLYSGEPTGFIYLGTLLANSQQPDSAVKYFKGAVQAAQDPKYAKERRDALFNVARVYHAAQRYTDAAAAYRDYLAAYPGDIQATAGLASIDARLGKRDEARALYGQIIERADSAEASDLFAAGREVLAGIASPPDSAAVKGRCREDAKGASPALTAHQVAVRCDSVMAATVKTYDASVHSDYAVVAQALESGLKKNPYNRDALFTLSGIGALMGDTARALGAGLRLYGIDPLSRASLRIIAQAWKLEGKSDSTLRYLQLADSLPVDVAVTSFIPGEKDVTLKGLLTNPRGKPSPAIALTIEFIDAKGTVVATASQDVPSLAVGESRPLEVTAAGAGAVAWRYRRAS